MSRADRPPATDLDSLLAHPTPGPDHDLEPDSDQGGTELDGGDERSTGPVRGRLEAWLRGGRSEHEAAEGGPVAAPIDGGSGDAVSTAVGGGGEGMAERDEGARSGGPRPLGLLRSLAVDSIGPNPHQPRQEFDEEGLEALARSIAALGVLQPILVRPLGGDRFELVAGERRWRASQLAGMRTIPAVVQEVDDRASLEQAIVENLHRSDLSAIEEAAAYQELMEGFGLTQEAVAARVGRSRSGVANTLRLLQLPAEVQRLVQSGRLSAGHARALLGADNPDVMVRLAGRVVDEELSVRATERLVREGPVDAGVGVGGETQGGPTPRGKSVGALEVERLLEERLATRIEVAESGRGGRLVIRYADQADLARIARLLLEPGSGPEA